MNHILDIIGALIVGFSNFMWGTPLVVLLIGGGIFFSIYSRFLPLRYIKHAIEILLGKHQDSDSKGQISHFQALSSALAATVGMGNISGVALAIAIGGPGALFWMWVSALFGMTTKFFTCSLAVIYRSENAQGLATGGPMYVIVNGLGKQWKPLAFLFCLAGMIGCLPIFQANQLTAILREFVFIPNNWLNSDVVLINLLVGFLLLIFVSSVIFGGLPRIASICSRLVPFMVVVYMFAVLSIIIMNLNLIPDIIYLILHDAFTGEALQGGAVGSIILIGAKRAAFSNEAGLGTAPMAHASAKTDEPIKEGLVAMLGPAIDTLIVCTCTALAILITNQWQTTKEAGINITLQAFEAALPFGGYILLGCAFIFAITSMFSFGYYGAKCFHFLTGKKTIYYYYFYSATIVLGAISSITGVISLIDGSFAVMSIPTMISTIYLAPKVVKAAKIYFKKIKVSN